MRKRFIILIDFSVYSANLIKYAYSWSQEINAELLLVHQTLVLTPGLSDNESREKIARQANEEALQKLKELAEDIISPTEKVSYSVSESHLQSTLSKLLEDPFENLIFVGLKGTGLLKKIFIGSVALQVIDNTGNIVVAMPKDMVNFSHKTIFVAVTEKHPLNILELNRFLSFIGKDKTTLTFFYLSKPLEKTKRIEKLLRDLTALFAPKFNTTFAIYEGRNSFEDMKEVINNKVDQLLVVQKGSRLLSDLLFRKFLINELVYNGQTPLIVLP